MATLTRPGSPTAEFGVALCLTTPDETWRKEVQVDTSNSFPDPDSFFFGGDERQARIPLPDDDTRRHFRWRTVRGACSTPGSWSSTVSAKPTDLPEVLPACPEVGVANVTGSEDRSAGTATVTVDIFGSSTYTVRVKKVAEDGTKSTVKTQTGVTAGGTNDPVTHTGNLLEKRQLKLYAEIEDEAQAAVVQTSGMFSFDPDEIPDFQDISLTVNDDGTVTYDVLGDFDTASGKLEFDFDGDSSVDETDTFSGNQGTGTTSGTTSEGDSGDVTITLYAGAGQTGTTRSKTAPLSRATKGQGSLISSFDIQVDSSGNIKTSGRKVSDAQQAFIKVAVNSGAPADPTAANDDLTIAAGTDEWAESDTGVNASGLNLVVAKAQAEDSDGNLSGEIEYAALRVPPFTGGDLPRVTGEATIDNFTQRLTSGGHIDGTMQKDDGSTNNSDVSGVVVSTNSPSGDYPEGTLWARV